MKTRLWWAMGAYVLLAGLAAFTLDGKLRYGIWILMGARNLPAAILNA